MGGTRTITLLEEKGEERVITIIMSGMPEEEKESWRAILVEEKGQKSDRCRFGNRNNNIGAVEKEEGEGEILTDAMWQVNAVGAESYDESWLKVCNHKRNESNTKVHRNTYSTNTPIFHTTQHHNSDSGRRIAHVHARARACAVLCGAVELCGAGWSGHHGA